MQFVDASSQQSSLDTKLRQYQALLEVAESIAVHQYLASLLQDLNERLQQVVRFDGINVVLYDPRRNLMRMHLMESSTLSRDRLFTELPIEEAASGWVWQTQQPMLITDLDAYEDRYPRVIAELRQYGIKTTYILPLTSVGRRLGALGFGSLDENAWSEDDRELLGQVARLVAVAVDNTINFESVRSAEQQAARARDHSQLLLEISNAISAHLDLRELLRVISPCLRNVIHHDFAGLVLHDPESGQLRAHALDFPMEKDLLEEGELFPLEGTPSGLAFTSRQTLLVRHQDLEKFSSTPLVKILRAEGVKSGCSVPLIAHGEAIGVLTVMSLRDEAFSESDAELLTQIGSQIAIAVENALNFERARAAEQQAKRQSDRLSLLLRINNAVVSQLDLGELLRVISGCLREVVHHDAAGILLYDQESDKLRMSAMDLAGMPPIVEENYLISLEGSGSGLAFTSGQPVFFDRFDLEKFPSEFTRRAYKAGIRSTGNVPLIAHGHKLGVLSVGRLREGAFSQEEVEMLCQSANQIAIALENALAFREIETLKNKLASEKLYLEDEIRTEHNFEELIGESQAFKRILKQVETVAPTGSAVLIRGETGTGKELFARAIHNLSTRRERTLVKINCAAIPMGLLESELFGHEKGAFTGAISQRAGRFELANRGTLFLDEVGDIPLELQPKLLRVLQEQEFERLGSTRTQKVDVRLIAATNCDLEQMVNDKKYRRDLYYRLNVFPITIPPLRERREDIPTLARFFTQRYARRLKKQITAIPAETMAALVGYVWPGNVRELEHFIERAVILTKGPDLEISLAELKSSEPAAATELITFRDAEREHILRALEETNWVVGGPKGAAARLGIKRTTLQSKMQKLGISRQT